MSIDPQLLDVSALPSMLLGDRRQFPTVSCVYLAMSSGAIQYIGRSLNLRHRWESHSKLRYFDLDSHIAWIEISDPKLLPEIESALIQWFRPPLNGEFADISQLDPEEIVSVNAKVSREFRAKAVIASRLLGTTVSEIIVNALNEAIAKAKQKDKAIAS